MFQTIFTLHIIIIVFMIILILLQRAEGGALGIGGGGGDIKNFMSARGVGSALTRTTAFLAAGFLITSLMLTILGVAKNKPSILPEAESPDSIYEPPLPELPIIPTPE